MTTSSAAPLSHTIDVETPELVVLSYTIAGVGSRSYAALIDYLICLLLLIVFDVGLVMLVGASNFRMRGSAPGNSFAWALSAFIFIQFAIFWGYYVLFEALSDGQTPGKRMQRIRVVRDGGYSVTFGASAIRNLVRLVDMQPGLVYSVGIISMVVSKTGKRLGDLAAGTIVVKEAIVRRPAALSEADTHPAEGPLPLNTLLTDAEFIVLERFVQRQRELEPGRRNVLAHQLAVRFASSLAGPADSTSESLLLSRLYGAEQRARGRGLAAKQDTGAARERHAIIAAGSARWASFAARLASAQRGGLKTLGEEGVREFVREYRDLAADLARLRTAARGRELDELFYLNRLASSAHNLLYRRRALPFKDIANYLFVQVPREIRASAAPIFLAAALMFGPAAIAYIAVVQNPGVAAQLLPPGMLDRAEAGVHRARAGDGYVDDPQLFRPVMATSIITNNVQVSFAVFAAGITAGILSAYVLLTNGISLGATFGLYSSKGIGSLLLAFVAPHGVLELTAICVAGGAGFLLAAALLIPGSRTRRTALRENGVRAIRLVAGSGLMLLIAGALEGFVSPIVWWPLSLKLSVSAVTALLLYAYLRLAPQRGYGAPTVRPAP